MEKRETSPERSCASSSPRRPDRHDPSTTGRNTTSRRTSQEQTAAVGYASPEMRAPGRHSKYEKSPRRDQGKPRERREHTEEEEKQSTTTADPTARPKEDEHERS